MLKSTIVLYKTYNTPSVMRKIIKAKINISLCNDDIMSSLHSDIFILALMIEFERKYIVSRRHRHIHVSQK